MYSFFNGTKICCLFYGRSVSFTDNYVIPAPAFTEVNSKGNPACSFFFIISLPHHLKLFFYKFYDKMKIYFLCWYFHIFNFIYYPLSKVSGIIIKGSF
jgi:hypothetical protein